MHAQQWPLADHEEVNCCRCGVRGTLLFTQRRFGIVRCPRCSLVFTSPRLKQGALQRLYEDSAYFDSAVYGFSKGINIAMLLQKAWTRGRLQLIRRLLGG